MDVNAWESLGLWWKNDKTFSVSRLCQIYIPLNRTQCLWSIAPIYFGKTKWTSCLFMTPRIASSTTIHKQTHRYHHNTCIICIYGMLMQAARYRGILGFMRFELMIFSGLILAAILSVQSRQSLKLNRKHACSFCIRNKLLDYVLLQPCTSANWKAGKV